MNPLFNYLGFSVVWFALVKGSALGFDLWALILLLGFAAWQLRVSHCLTSDLRLVAAALLIGPLVDFGMIRLGWISYSGYHLVEGYPPFWIDALWISFALTINHSLRFLHGRPLLASLAGAISAPLAYGLGVRMGAAEFTAPAWQPLLLLAVSWAIILPLACRLAAKPESASRARLGEARSGG